MKKSSQKSPKQDPLPLFLEVEKRVFTIVGEDLYIGKDKIEANLRSVLRDEAENLKNSRLWEILNASVINEAYNLALIQSADFDHVQFAKGLKHWSVFMMKVINILSQKG